MNDRNISRRQLLGNYFEKLRLDQKQTKKQFSESIGISRAMVTQLSLGNREFTLSTLHKYADYYSISAGNVLNDIEHEIDRKAKRRKKRRAVIIGSGVQS